MKWINIEDQLPKKHTDVLIFDEDSMSVGFIGSEGDWIIDSAGLKPTHWMPLPEPPKSNQ